jgi:hypothetical protein
MSRRRPEPPPGYLSTSRAAELLRTSDSYVRRLAREPADDGLPVLASVVLRSDGGGEYRYVLLSDVEKFRNARLRRAGAGEDPGPLMEHSTTDLATDTDGLAHAGPQPDGGDPYSPLVTELVSRDAEQSRDAGTTSSAGSSVPAGGDWQLELDLASANARLNEMALRVETLERLNQQLALDNKRLQRRLGELARAQMQLLDGYLVNDDRT